MFNFGSGIKNIKNNVVEKKEVEEEVRGEMKHGELNFEEGPLSFYLDDWKSITEVDGTRDYVEGIGKSLDTTKWGQLKLPVNTFTFWPSYLKINSFCMIIEILILGWEIWKMLRLKRDILTMMTF